MRAENECHVMTPDVVTSLGELKRPWHERERETAGCRAAVTTCSTFITLQSPVSLLQRPKVTPRGSQRPCSICSIINNTDTTGFQKKQ